MISALGEIQRKSCKEAGVSCAARQEEDSTSALKAAVPLRLSRKNSPEIIEVCESFLIREASIPNAPNMIAKGHLLIVYFSLGTLLHLLNMLIALKVVLILT